MLKKKLLIALIIISCISAAGYFFVRKVAAGGFEKKLIPAYTESGDGWSDLVGPVIKSKWRQDSVFAEFTPGNELPGCWSVAFAQVLSFYKLQPSGRVNYLTGGGVHIDLELSRVSFDSIVPVIKSDTPQEYSSETARFCYEVALVLQKDFGVGEYKDISAVPEEVSDHFDCTVMKQDSNLPGIINNELNAGKPVVAYFDDILGIRLVRNGHAVVIDGKAIFNNDEFVHVNFGWGGKSDGWYNLKDLSKERKLRYVFTITPGQRSKTAGQSTLQ